MKLIAVKDVAISKLSLKGGWKRQLDQRVVDELAQAIKDGSCLQPIRITPAKEVIYGYHRIAAYQQLKHKTIRVDVVEYENAEEREADQILENVARRQIAQEERETGLRRLLEIEQSRGDKPSELFVTVQNNSQPESQETPTVTEPSRKRGRPKSEKRAAIKAVAEKTGVSESTVRRAAEEPAKEADKPPLPFDTLGHEMPQRERDAALGVHADLAQAERYLISAQALVTSMGRRLEEDAPAVRRVVAVERIHAALKEAASLVRGEKPMSICPYCLCGGRQPLETCPGCKGAGYVTHLHSVPKELLLR